MFVYFTLLKLEWDWLTYIGLVIRIPSTSYNQFTTYYVASHFNVQNISYLANLKNIILFIN